MRKKIVAGNWKMNTTVDTCVELVEGLVKGEWDDSVTLIVAPPFTQLAVVQQKLGNSSSIQVSAQNCHEKLSGAYTGEVSPEMLKAAGIPYVILGHSERRTYFGETDAIIYQKTKAALSQGLSVILCVGEKLDQREVGDHFKVVQKQLEETLCLFNSTEAKNIVVAYEPVWAIGTGKTATAAQAEEMHGFIREVIANHFDQKFAEDISILYGGSCKPGNAKEIFSQHNVDGGLIGGASLQAEDFLAIANSF